MNMKLVLGGLAIALVAYEPAMWLFERSTVSLNRHESDSQLATFKRAVQDGRESAMRTRGIVGVRLTDAGWEAFADAGQSPWRWDSGDKQISRGDWPQGLVIRNNMKDGQFFYSADGTCHAAADAQCVPDDVDEEGVVSTMAVLVKRDAKRTYTLLFDREGVPLLAFDDF